MRTYNFEAILKAALRVACLLPFAAVAALGQQQINLTAGPATATLPDGTMVPMWGYSCGAPVSGSLATCAKLNATTGWSPVVITIPTSASGGLSISLTNNLSFIPAGTGSTPNNIPTSIVIVGQLGGGLGTTATSTPSPVHPPQGPTWPIAGDNSGPTFNPPGQGNRVQSFSSEVQAKTTALLPAWANLRPGTYLFESGTHPSIQGPMGLYGILVVTSAPTIDPTTGAETAPGTAYPGVNYNADVPLLLSEIDPAQNNAVNKSVTTQGFVETATHNLKLADSVNSIAVTDGGAGYKSTDVLTVNITGGGTPTTPATATAMIDADSTSPTYGQVISITIGNPGAGYTSNPTVTISGGTPTKVATAVSGLLLANSDPCANGVPACYPPAVNYTPLYYLFNGVAFDKTNAPGSLFSAMPGSSTAAVTGNVLVRFVNAGLRMHIPSIVGSLTGPATTPVGGFSLIAEDGNVLPGLPRVQSGVFMAAGKTYDVMINVPAAGGNALPVYDRELSLSGNATARDAGMLAYIGINGSTTPTTGVFANAGAVARSDIYNSLIAGQTLTVSDPSKGVIANDTNVSGVQLLAVPTNGTVTLNSNGTFTYVPNGTVTSDSFTYCANGTVTGGTCSSNVYATVTLGAATIEDASGVTCTVPTPTYSSTVATSLSIKSPGVLSFCKDAAGYPLTVNAASVAPATGLTLSVDKNGGFNASVPSSGTYTFSFKAQNSQGTVSSTSATATLVFPSGSGLVVTVLDGQDKKTQIKDYRWIIEEDRTFYVDPTNTTNNGTAVIPTFGTNFHTSHMPLVATGCTGPLSCESGQTRLGQPVVCDVGNGDCRADSTQNGQTPVDPKDVALDPTKRYYISVLPGDAANPFNAAYAGAPDCSKSNVGGDATTSGTCGHGMGGAPIGARQLAVTVLSQPTPNPPAKLTVFVFEDDYPLNGEHDASGGIDVLAPNEPGLGSFQITLFDDAGGTGDATGQPTYDMFNMPLSNSLAGQIDPVTRLDACPISVSAREGFDTTTGAPNSPLGMTSMIVTCPRYEADGKTLSPLAGQAVVANLYQGRYGVVATPGADRIARGEEWLQTNTLDGQKAHDSFMRIGEPAYFQEFGPAGYHVSIGFANPKIINDRRTSASGTGLCDPAPNGGGLDCTNEVKGHVTTARMSRPPDERLYGSGSHDSYAFTQCYASLGNPDGADFAFTKCADDGSFDFTGIPSGNFKVTIFDQWNDQVVDGISTPVGLAGLNNKVLDLGELAAHQWQANIYTRTFFDPNYSGVPSKDQSGVPCTAPNTPVGCNPNYGSDTSTGLTLVATNIRFRDGSYSNFNNTDLSGNAGFNEIFPLFSWYTIETDSTRYKSTGTHVVVDAGGPTDGAGGGSSNIGNLLANTVEPADVALPSALRVPGAFYCANADCTDAPSKLAPGGSGGSTGRVDPPFWFGSYGWQGFSGQNSFLEFGKKPFAAGENGGIHGHVVYASTRPFDDPQLLLQLSWEPLVPHVRINLYKEGVAPDGVTTTLSLVDHTDTSSFDDWAQGFRSDGVPNMNCPGQSSTDPFFFALKNQPNYLDWYNSQHGGPAATSLPSNSQFKCYDGLHNWNQLQPAPYDGIYSFPSVTSINPATGKPAGTNCTGCIKNPDTSDPYRSGAPMLPAGKYVVEVVVPPGYELVKEEDKNILIGDNYIAPVTQQFAGLGNIFIIPDQAAVGAAYNPNNPQNPTQDLGSTTFPRHEGDTGSVEAFWPCVGASRIVPDYISLFPQSAEVSPFAGATRNLCDRKEVTLQDQVAALAKFYIFTSTHIASHFTGVITDDFTAEFDPFSPQFGEKFAPANLPVSIKDWAGNEIARTYTDSWGAYNGLNYSTWEVNPPNPTGYGPTMMVMCMNDRGSGPIPDPLYQEAYSQFCYELPFMPGQTGYFDTPVVPTSAFAGAGYNNPDCAYPDTTPAIKEVDGAGVGPWVHTPSTSISALNLLTSGSGYSSTFNFNITGDGGTGAAGQVTDLKLVSITSIPCNSTGANACSNFATNPAATLTGGGGSGATATATKSGTTISFVITGGSGYTSKPTVVVSRVDGTNRTVGGANVIMGVNGVILTAYGSGYAGSSFTVNISGASGAGASATALISSTTDTLTITALGDQTVTNYAYSGPSATTTPYNQKIVTRHYGFGSAKGTVTIGGITVPSAGITWSDSTIVLTVPRNVPPCAVQQQAQYGGLPAFCGELVITAANGKQSIDTVTVNIGGKAPIHVSASGTIQSAIDTAQPGDLIIVDPTCTAAATTVACTTTSATHTASAHNEMLLMWKPVRLQGVGAATSIVDANAHPAGKLDPWRQQVVCLFGLTPDGQPNTSDTSCMAGWTAASGGPNFPTMIVDRVPMEGILGWDTTVNGNLAEQLIEPSLLGAYEGAAVTVLGKGVNIPAGAADAWGSGAESAFPAGSTLLTAADCGTGVSGTPGFVANTYPSNFYCNPSSIDGLSLTNSSQGGGGILVHAWGHNIQIANNRVRNNQGTLSGGITIGQGEHIEVPLSGAATTIPPGSCEVGAVANQGLPFCYDMNVNVHHNAITRNASLGDEIFSSSPAGAGGVTVCNGSDYYQFDYNWVCGNMSTGDGGGVAHIGWSKNGHIEHNAILFNQSTNPTITTNGGGVLVMGAPDPDPPCSTNDQDCLSAPGSIPPSDGTGPGLVINANLIQGNAADSGSGGGLRLQHINGTDVLNFPNGQQFCAHTNLSGCLWNSVTVTNNIIDNNVAGWDGGGVSLLDALAVNIINNTIVSNDSTASSGVLFGSLFAPLASAPGTNCTANNGSQSCPQVAGLVSVTNSPVLVANLPASGFTCPPNHGVGDSCRNYSVPLLANDVIWQNRSFFIGVGGFGTGTQNQQKVVTLYNSFTSAAAASQTASGACPAASYWEIGVRGDTGPANHASGFSLAPIYSVLTDAADYSGVNTFNTGSNPVVVSQYCNGSRVPPENGGMGWQVPPGTNEGNALPTPVFSLSPSATVDEGNNWVNISWGPLSTTKPVTGGTLGDYEPAPGSPVINYIPLASTGGLVAPGTDFFGRNRPSGNGFDVGAVEWRSADAAPSLDSITPNSGLRGNTVQVTLIGNDLTGATAVNVAGTGVTVTVFNVISDSEISATFTISATAGLTARNVTVSKTGFANSNPVTFTVANPPVATLTSISPTSGARGTNVVVTLNGANFTATGNTIAVSGTLVTVSGVSVNAGGTQLTATFTIAATAATTSRNVTVTNPSGSASNAVTFTVVNPPVATLTSISPASGARGTNVAVTLNGTNFTATGNTIAVSGTLVTVSGVSVNAVGTQLTATFTIAATAATTSRNVTVTNPSGTASNAVTFKVN